MELRRHLGTVSLTLYGVGVIVGAGIYVLVGKVAGIVGYGVWAAFLAAAVAAVPTGLSYASLASRYPRSAGEAVFVERAFGRPWMAFVVGMLVLASGVSSTAAVSHGFANYLTDLIPMGPLARVAALLGFLIALSWVNFRGIEESTWLNVLCTIFSVGALVLLSVVAMPRWGDVDFGHVGAPGTEGRNGGSLIAGTALAFYAFIGFEDMCNVAEEVKRPERTVPRAIVISMLVVTVIYVAVGISVVSAATPAELAASDIPLALVWERLLPNVPSLWLSLVALFAVTNTALFNLIMGSRILYGMGRQGWVPAFLARIHPVRRTPVWSVFCVFLLTAIFALTGVLKVLAEATNAILLVVFFCINLSLVLVRARKIPSDDPDAAIFQVPWAVPLSGLAITGYLVTRFSADAYLRAAGLVAVGLLLYGLARLGRRFGYPAA